MKKKMLGLIALSLTLILSTLAACTTPVLTLDDEAIIYAAVVRQLYTVDHTFGEPPNFPVVYLPRATDDRAGDPRSAEVKSSILTESVQEAIVAALDDLPAEFIWVDERDDVPMDRGIVEGNGAMITWGNIYLQRDGTVQVAASVFFSREGGAGMTYIVEKVDGVWKITGNTGTRWIS